MSTRRNSKLCTKARQVKGMKPSNFNPNKNTSDSTAVKLEQLVPSTPFSSSSILTFHTPIHSVHSYRQNYNKGNRRNMYSASQPIPDTVSKESYLWKQFGLSTWVRPKPLAIEEREIRNENDLKRSGFKKLPSQKSCIVPFRGQKRNLFKKFASQIAIIVTLSCILTVGGMNFLKLYMDNFQSDVIDKGSRLNTDISSHTQIVAVISTWMYKTESEIKCLKRSLRQAQSELSDVKKELDRNAVIQHSEVSVDVLAELLGPSADFAAEKNGGSILATPDTETYYPTPAVAQVLGFQFLTSVATSASTILKGVLQPGDCWAFHGSFGRVVIKLARPTQVTAISIEHIPEALSINGNIESAPWHFQLFGTTKDMMFTVFLGEFEYNKDGALRQTFYVNNMESIGIVNHFEAVEVRILSNYGNENYTCVYRIRIHGNT